MESTSAADAPIVFISYHREDALWALDLAQRLRHDWIDARIVDHLAPGESLTAFYEKAIRESQRVLILCSPDFKRASDGGEPNGEAYALGIIKGELLTGSSRAKLIPLLVRGLWPAAAPIFLLDSKFLDVSSQTNLETQYPTLLEVINGSHRFSPPIGGGVSDSSRLCALVIGAFPGKSQDIQKKFAEWSTSAGVPPVSEAASRSLLRIVHVSGMRIDIGDVGSYYERKLLGRMLRLAGLDTAQALRGHDPLAAEEFDTFIASLSEWAGWHDCPNWLVDTGDWTNFGDEASLRLADHYFSRFAGRFDASCRVFGVRDLWGGGFLKPGTSEKHRELRRTAFGPHGTAPMLLSMRSGLPTVQLAGLDTIPNDRAGHMFGHAVVEKRDMLDVASKFDRVALRVIVSHHPLAPLPRPRRVSGSMEGVVRAVRPHVVLSGYYPENLALAVPMSASHSTRSRQTPEIAYCQFSVGSLLSLGPSTPPSGQVAEVLEFNNDPRTPDVVTIDRTLVTRSHNIGPFLFNSESKMTMRIDLGEKQ